MHKLAQLDHRFVWHPFTQMRDWLQSEPIVIVEGEGAVLRDVNGKEYLDANSSIWTNLHGHNHPRINAAITRQLRKIAHSSALGFANEPASLLAERLVRLSNPRADGSKVGSWESGRVKGMSTPAFSLSHLPTFNAASSKAELTKVFYSDDGSTALEVALKLAHEFTRRTRGGKARPKFLSLEGAYHGDTVGAVSLGHIDLFHKAYGGLLFKSDKVMSPYCYRCPFNRARPDREDARKYRKCQWECVGLVEKTFRRQRRKGNPYAAFVFEPLMQGAAGMIAQPSGWLGQVTSLARAYDALLVADEVMTGFGRTGVTCHVDDAAVARVTRQPETAKLFACSRVGVQPDLLCAAKGLTGGYLPMAATLTTQEIFDAFLGRYDEFKTFFHGHSYTANQLGAAAALASLEILRRRESVRARAVLQQTLAGELKQLWSLPQVGDVRQVGVMAGIELVRDWRTREAFALRERAGIRVCEALARRGVLTRPIGNVIVLMPPFCTTPVQVRKMISALVDSVKETFR